MKNPPRRMEPSVEPGLMEAWPLGTPVLLPTNCIGPRGYIMATTTQGYVCGWHEHLVACTVLPPNQHSRIRTRDSRLYFPKDLTRIK